MAMPSNPHAHQRFYEELIKAGIGKSEIAKYMNQNFNQGLPCGLQVAPAWVEEANASYSPMKMVAMRMRWANEYFPPKPFDHVHAVRVEEEVFVFAVVRGEALTIREQWPLFPSDALVTQLRLLEEK